MSQAIGCQSVRIVLKKKTGTRLLAFNPFLGRNSQKVATAGQKFRKRNPVGKALWLELLVGTVGLAATS